MELENELSNNIDNTLENINEEQTKFLETTLGKVVDTGIDIGIRALLPNFIEEQIIDIKDNIFENGLVDGIKETVTDTIDTGKDIIGIFKGEITEVSQIKDIVDSGNLIDGVSETIDFVLDTISPNSSLQETAVDILKNGKDVLLDNIEGSLEKTVENQVSMFKDIESYMESWNNNFNNQDFTSMDEDYLKIEEALKSVMPMESLINEARSIENMHNLIKNNGQDFNISDTQLELATKI